MANLFNCPTAGAGGTDSSYCLGGSNGAGFGWDDMTIHKIGYQWEPGQLEDWTFRLGFSHGSQPIEKSEVLFNMMAPGVIENHFTSGFSHKMDSGREYSLTFMFAPEKKSKAPIPSTRPSNWKSKCTSLKLSLVLPFSPRQKKGRRDLISFHSS